MKQTNIRLALLVLILILIPVNIFSFIRLYNAYYTFKFLDIFTEELEENKQETEVVEEHVYLEPCSTSATKSYMYVQSITSKSSKQYQYIQENMTAHNGLLFDDEGYIGVALGSYFGEIGSRYMFYLDSGEIIPVVKIESKADEHTNNGCEQKWDKSVIEFVIDKETNTFEYGSNGYILNGNFNNIYYFQGKIENVRVMNNY